MKSLNIFFIVAIMFAVILTVLTINSDTIESADLVICKRENGGRKEVGVQPVHSVSKKYIVTPDGSVFNKGDCELLEKCARIKSYLIQEPQFKTGDVVGFTCTGNIIYPEKV